ncbi:MAG: tRNA (5-methylaminomethyl-2-thiouridine)(34)-methyltransferase MnmD, partial [Pseudomonadota bacterium]|nr:tRNA (5-methylaminomethyl-2-thiouridine)(34)-methyltransferase MnmD [Pseudomonadota bacterium]
MRSEPLAPPRLAFEADGRPRSLRHDDLYYPRQGALAQALQVFLAGSDLPARWRQRERFVVLEAGFGFGSNFLATWAAWRDDPQRPRRLHYIAIEAAPPTRPMLAAISREAPMDALTTELLAAWPPHTCDLHQLDFAGGAVRLSLAFGSVAAWLPQIEARVDAFFLDGFAPARNPEMWESRVFKALARLAVPGATLATSSTVTAVGKGLASAGFAVTAAPGDGGEPEVMRATYAPAFVPRRSARARTGAAPADERIDPVVIVGAGIAGCAIAAALAAQGRRSLLLERRTEIAAEASGNAIALFHGVVHAEDGRHARFFRAAALQAQRIVGRFIAADASIGAICGVLRLATKHDSAAALRGIAGELGLGDDYAFALDAVAASDLAGVRLATPAWC